MMSPDTENEQTAFNSIEPYMTIAASEYVRSLCGVTK
jgi:hypothetical protein